MEDEKKHRLGNESKMWEKGFDFPLKNFVDIFPRFYKRKNMAYKKIKKGVSVYLKSPSLKNSTGQKRDSWQFQKWKAGNNEYGGMNLSILE